MQSFLNWYEYFKEYLKSKIDFHSQTNLNILQRTYQYYNLFLFNTIIEFMMSNIYLHQITNRLRFLIHGAFSTAPGIRQLQGADRPLFSWNKSMVTGWIDCTTMTMFPFYLNNRLSWIQHSQYSCFGNIQVYPLLNILIGI